MELLPGFADTPAGLRRRRLAIFTNEECVNYLGVPTVDADWFRNRWTARRSIAKATSRSSSQRTASCALS